MTVLWTAEQHALLGAMGLTVYAHADLQPWPAPPPAPAFENLAPAPRRAPGRPARPVPPPEAGVAEPAPAVPVRRAPPPVTTAPATPAPRRRGGLLAALPDRLMLAVLRASRLDPNDPATQARMAGWPLDRLRADPAAKRALWRELRQLRRQRQGH